MPISPPRSQRCSEACQEAAKEAHPSTRDRPHSAQGRRPQIRLPRQPTHRASGGAIAVRYRGDRMGSQACTVVTAKKNTASNHSRQSDPDSRMGGQSPGLCLHRSNSSSRAAQAKAMAK